MTKTKEACFEKKNLKLFILIKTKTVTNLLYTKLIKTKTEAIKSITCSALAIKLFFIVNKILNLSSDQSLVLI